MTEIGSPNERRKQQDEYFSGSRSYFDKKLDANVIHVHAGDCFVTDAADEVAATVLGSCISACIRDPEVGIGGMNHFLLPGLTSADANSARFGAFAMEQLINEILKRGAKKDRLEIKIFGGGNVIESSAMIGDKNAFFVKEYLQNEGLHIVTEDVGGTYPRKVRYYPNTGKVLLMKMQRKEDMDSVASEEVNYHKSIAKPAIKSAKDAELF